MFDLSSGFFRNAIHLHFVEMTTFIMPRGLFQFLTMPRGHAGARGAFVHLMHRVTAGLDHTRMQLNDASVFGSTPELSVEIINAFLTRFEEDSLKLSPEESEVGAMVIDLREPTVSPSGLRPNPKTIDALTKVPMAADVSQLHSFCSFIHCGHLVPSRVPSKFSKRL